MNLSSKVRLTFMEASLQREAAMGLRADDWARYREVKEQHDRRLTQESDSYRKEYDERVAVAKRGLIEQAAAKRRPFLPRFLGHDRFDRGEIDRLAHRAVRLQHQTNLEGLEASRQDQIRELLAGAKDRQELGQEMRQQFTRATNRRSGEDRRSGPSR